MDTLQSNGSQTTERLLQFCPLCQPLRKVIWPDHTPHSALCCSFILSQRERGGEGGREREGGGQREGKGGRERERGEGEREGGGRERERERGSEGGREGERGDTEREGLPHGID